MTGIASSATSSRFNLIVNGCGALLALGLVLYALFDYESMLRQLNKDSVSSTGWFEHLTWIVLIPGILAGLLALTRYRLLHPIVALWLLLWCLACMYFAGEEASWGQWYFGWKTPESIATFNDQRETNLHNMSSWLDEKPRALVEVFIFLCGFMIPLIKAFKPDWQLFRNDRLAEWESWVVAPQGLIALGALFLAVRLARWLPNPTIRDLFGSSELREFCTALFLSVYLASFLARLVGRPANDTV